MPTEVYPDSLRAVLRFGGFQSVGAFCRQPDAPTPAVMHRVFVRRSRSLTPHVLQQIAAIVRMDPEAVRRTLAMDSFVVVASRPRRRVILRTNAAVSLGDVFQLHGANAEWDSYRAEYVNDDGADGMRTVRLMLSGRKDANA